jgi:DEAD/DEAH box helicase domain-containing protein
MTVEKILAAWRSDPRLVDNVTLWHVQPAVEACWKDIPFELNHQLISALANQGIHHLYSHQREAWEETNRGNNLVIATGTASGKTLCYNLPVLDRLMRDSEARALYLFPTKALAQDQLKTLQRLTGPLDHPSRTYFAQIYDGDTPSDLRPLIRKESHLIITNPDMLHMGILPHHTIWVEFFRRLQFIVIDEIHIYRGIFGSHMANVIRRLKRIASFYGSNPLFITTSATIANPQGHAERLLEASVHLINNDGSAYGERHLLIYDPPIINKEVGLRRSSLLESVWLTKELADHNIQTIAFSRTRKTVELALTYLRNQSDDPQKIRGYRSGYLPAERRSIEHGLRHGNAQVVVATNALELGIDIGGIDAAILIGYPGTIAATRQQIGRAGRKAEASLAVLVATADALDQFLAHHPEYLIDRSPEQALIQPNQLLIALSHLRCAAFELPFQTGDIFGNMPPEMLAEMLQVLEASQVLFQSHGKYFWMADQYPANDISLRSASSETILLQTEEEGVFTTIGKVDQASAYWMIHPQAVYLHEGKQFVVDNLDLEKKVAFLLPFNLDYYTEPKEDMQIQKTSTNKDSPITGGGIAYGDLIITNQVTGFRRIKWSTREVLGVGMVDLPKTQLITTGFWLWLNEQTVIQLQAEKLWTNSPNDYGADWNRLRRIVLERDHHRCQICGAIEMATPFQVHHKKPFRAFTTVEAANKLDNLITVCPTCHRKVEMAVHMRSGLAGLAYIMGKIASLFLMCDEHDLGVSSDPQSSLAEGGPAVVIYDNFPGGIGLSEALYDMYHDLINQAQEIVLTCPCTDGCPACVGPAGENGLGGKRETLAIFASLTQSSPGL